MGFVCGRVPDYGLLSRSSVRRRRPVDESIMHDDGSPALAVHRLVRDSFSWRDGPALSAFTLVQHWLIRHTGTYSWLLAGPLTWLKGSCSKSRRIAGRSGLVGEPSKNAEFGG